MDALDAILFRRSIRRYAPDQVTDESVTRLLEAAMSAPSSGNEQPWHFVVIKSRKLLDDIAQIHPNAQMLKGAPLAIMVCGEERREKYKGFWVQDCSAATENILIAAHALGMGSVWVGVYPIREKVDALRRLLGIPEYIIPFSLLPVGYPDETKPPSRRYDPERIHRDYWDSNKAKGLNHFSRYFWLKMRLSRVIRGWIN